MFQNIGGKIKTLATVICWIGIVSSVIAGIAVIINQGAIGLLIMIAGSVVSWISSFFVYGFGELIEKTNEIANNTKITNNNSTVEDKISALKKWKKQGLITEEEFLQKIEELK